MLILFFPGLNFVWAPIKLSWINKCNFRPLISNVFNDLKTIPNILSVSRLVLIPAMLIPCFLIGDETLARKVFLIMFILIGVTDKLDGTLARYLNQTSSLGAKLDTMADTVFYPFIALWLYRFENTVVGEWWILVFILLGLFFLKMILGKIKFGEIPSFHTIGGKTFAASLFFFMITTMLYPCLLYTSPSPRDRG